MRTTTARVIAVGCHVTIDEGAVVSLARRLARDGAGSGEWDPTHHFVDHGPLTAQYLLVLDALNFCFWPAPGWRYDRLAAGLKFVLERDPTAFAADRLASLQPATLADWLGTDLPLLDERARLLREVGYVLGTEFDGQAAALVSAAERSANRLVSLVTAYLPGFRDHAVYQGQQVFFYKRAQILVADLWGAYRGHGLGAFGDIGDLTTFADYRVPQWLRHLGVLRYELDLAERVDALAPLMPGSEEEIEIRAATIQAVERLRDALAAQGQDHRAVEIDWRLWQEGETLREKLPPHHRVFTIYY